MSSNSPAISGNGVAVRAIPSPKTEDASDHQAAALDATEKAQNAADAWRRIASGAILVALGTIVALIVLSSRFQHDVFVYRDGAKGLTYQGQAIPAVTPSQAAIEAQIGAFVKAYRNVPGIDYALVDQNVLLALQMTADVAPAHAHQDAVAYFTAKANNPKLLGAAGMVRTVLDPVIASPISAQTYTVSWAEETTTTGHAPRRVFHQGTLTIAPPIVPTDAQTAATNPAGVVVIQTDLHL
ncbi:MAG: hypothetical protein NVSMB21_25060 [Vulcanimicrobiaceae bacterium]